MGYKQRRKLYSQNNLVNPKLVAKLIRLSSIDKKDAVLEIGSGKGIITSELVKTAEKVIAVELDEKLCLYLKTRFQNVNNFELHLENFLDFALPPYSYKVFSNIPFIITADVIRKLTSDKNFEEGYLIVQKEAAKKFIGMPFDSKNQMMATLLKPWFDISIFWKFKRSDFIPNPGVDTLMIRIIRVTNPLIADSEARLYRNFIVYTYGRAKVAKLTFPQLFNMFKLFLATAALGQKREISQEAQKILSEQKLLHKIHRTRTDKRWRKYK